LDRLGFDVIGFNVSANDAYKNIKSLHPDMVVLNIGYHASMDGIDVAHIISRTFSIPIIFLSALADEATIRRALEVDPYAFITKPYDQKSLMRAMSVASQRFRLVGHDNP
jgi:AmiR/NasT family two-component response regulator